MVREVWSETDPELKTDVSKGWMNRDMPSSQSVCSSTSSSSDNNKETSLSSLESFLFLPQLPVDGDDGDEEAWLFRHYNQEQRQQKRSLASFLTIVKSTKSSRIHNNHHSNQSDEGKSSRKCCAVTTNTTIPNAKDTAADGRSRSGHSRGCNNSQLCGKSGCPTNSLFSLIAANDTVTTTTAASTNSATDTNAEVNNKSQQTPNSTRILIKNTSTPAILDGSGNSHNNSPFYLAANHHSLLHQPHHHFSRRRLLIFRICQAFSVLICILLLINLVRNSIWVNNEYKNRLNPIPTSSSLASMRVQNRLIQSWNMPSIISPSSSPHFKVPQMISNSTRNDNNVHNLLLLDVPNFRFLINNKTKCNIPRDDDNYADDGSNNDGGVNSIFFMIIVHSSPQNFVERQAIRTTWGSLQRLGQFHIRLVFLLGHESSSVDASRSGGDDEVVTTTNSTDDESDKGSSIFLKLQQESEQHGDIVTGSFRDSYRNLTYKHLMGYLWVLNHCSHAKYVLKADDDAWIDIFQLFEFLMRTFGLDPEAALICNVFPEGTKPVRQTDIQGKKWAVTYDEYPYESYPKYCGGLAYLATPNVIQEIYRMSHNMKNKYLWIDDVFVTGILRERAHVEPFYLNLRYSYEPEEYRKWLGAVAKNDNEVNDNNIIISQNRKNEGVGVAVLSNRMKNDIQPAQHQKIPFMIVHLERGSQLRREMEDLWNKTVSVWSGSGRII